MRPLVLTAAATLALFALGCSGSEAVPASPTEAAPAQPDDSGTDGATGDISSPQVYFIQIET